MADTSNKYIVQSSGGATINYSYPKELIGAGKGNVLDAEAIQSLTGFKLNANYFDANQAMDNSFVIPLLNGGSIQITNSVKCGSLNIIAIRSSEKLTDGDIVSIATAQRDVAGGDGTGATITVDFAFNGQNFTVKFFNCTVAQVKPLTIAGNDAPDYNVRFNYSYYEYGGTVSSESEAS